MAARRLYWPGLAAALLLTFAAASAAMAETPPPTREETIEAVSSHFASVPTMSGEFVQFGPSGQQTEVGPVVRFFQVVIVTRHQVGHVGERALMRQIG